MGLSVEVGGAPGVTVAVHLPDETPTDQLGWIRELTGLPELALVPEQRLAWPAQIGESGGKTVALFRFFDRVAAVVVDAPRDAAAPILATVRPRWDRRDEAVVLSDLWA